VLTTATTTSIIRVLSFTALLEYNENLKFFWGGGKGAKDGVYLGFFFYKDFEKKKKKKNFLGGKKKKKKKRVKNLKKKF